MFKLSDGLIWTHKTAGKFAENHLQNAAYFNSGILLMNLKNMAKNQQLLLDVKVPLKYPDQDILNVGQHKQNYYQYVPHDMYTMFYKHCTALNFYPDEFCCRRTKTFSQTETINPHKHSVFTHPKQHYTAVWHKNHQFLSQKPPETRRNPPFFSNFLHTE